MAISEIYPPDDTYAGGVRLGSREYRVLWSQIATGNLSQKIAKAIEFFRQWHRSVLGPRNRPSVGSVVGMTKSSQVNRSGSSNDLPKTTSD